jgi:hypothetical protein
LRRSLLIARELYLAHSGFETAFGLHAACIGAQVEACAKEDIPPLAAAYGPAEIDKAILDALLRGAGVNFFDGMAAISPASMRGCRAISAMPTSSRFLGRPQAAGARRDPAHGRHGRQGRRRGRCRRHQKENAGARYFKLKLNGDPAHDAAPDPDRQGTRHAAA